jgi:hypothetical protein
LKLSLGNGGSTAFWDAATFGLILSAWRAFETRSVGHAAMGGACAALMFAGKETAILHLLALTVAAIVFRVRNLSGRNFIPALRPRPLVAAGSMAGLVRASTPERERERDPNKRPITLNRGFASNVFVQGTMDNPTTIVFGPDNKLYIADISGAIWVAEDANHDGVAEDIKPFADGFALLVGLAWHDGELYTASSGKIEALRDSNADGVADQRRLVVETALARPELADTPGPPVTAADLEALLEAAGSR